MSGPPTIRLLGNAFQYWERRQQAVSHNLANASTEGFRGERVFARALEGARAPVAEGRTDFRAGAFTRTDNPLDVALDGDGFLVVETPGGERYTRGGSLSLDSTGVLVDPAGHPVMGQSGPIVLPGGDVTVGPRGELTVDGEVVDRLRLERFRPDVRPVRDGDTHFARAADGDAEPDPDTEVLQGHVEESNVDPVGSLVEMISVQRAYAALERSTRAVDGVMDTIANRLARIS